jgi:integrase/recombinase XerD
METYLKPGDVKRMEQAALCLRDRLLIRLLFRLGCRVSEALALKVEDIDLSKGSATIVHLKSRVRLFCPGCGAGLGRSHRFCPGCGNKVEEATKREAEHRRLRTLPVDAETVAMLRDYIRRGGPVSRCGAKLLFGVNRHRAWQIIRDCANKAGLSPLINPETGKIHGVSPHRLRDAFAVNAVKLNDSGDGLRLLQEHLGHASFNTTAKYRKVAGEEHREWYDNLWRKDSNGATS